MSQTLRRVQDLVRKGDYLVSRHGFRELAADDIVIEDNRDAQPIHVMWGVPRKAGSPAVLVTAYRPAPERWSADFRERKKR